MKTNQYRNLSFGLKPDVRLLLVIVLIFSLIMGCAGDPGTKERSESVTGALVGAGVGLLVGVVRGNPEAGLAVGAVVGASQGAYEGWKEDQEDNRTRMIADAIRESGGSGAAQQPNASATTRAREELTRFLGVWGMEGWVQAPDGQKMGVRAKVNGNIEMTYFVELAYIDLKVTGIDSQLWGSSMFGYDEDDGYNISTRMNTLPEAVRTTGGTFDQSSRSLTFKGADYLVVIRFENPDRFVFETSVPSGDRWQQVEFYTFTRTQ